MRHKITMCLLTTLLILYPMSTTAFQLPEGKSPYHNALSLDELFVQVLPEFETPKTWDSGMPSVLISYYGEFVNRTDTVYEDYIYMPIPTNQPLFQLSMVCETDRGIVYKPNEIVDQHLKWKPSAPIGINEKYSFMIEYFYNPIEFRENGLKDFTFQFHTDKTIPIVYIDVHMPNSSTNHHLHPEYIRHFTINQNVEVYSFIFNDTSKTKPVNLNVQYQKHNNLPTNVSNDRFDYEFWKMPIHPDFIGLIIFTLILIIIGYSVITISSSNKHNRHMIVDDGKEIEFDQLLDEQQSRRRELRSLLLQGKINEETYRSLLEEE